MINNDACNEDIYRNGKVFEILDLPKDKANEYCLNLSNEDKLHNYDWHYFGGRVVVKRLEREFKKSKFIILHGTDIKEMDILTWNTGRDVPYYENAVFESKKEAKRFAELEEMDDLTIVEVLNEN